MSKAAELGYYLEQLRTADPERRYEAALWLGQHGDASVIIPLEQSMLHDDSMFSMEGAFVDTPAAVSEAVLTALTELYARTELGVDDEARVFAMLALPPPASGKPVHDKPLNIYRALAAKGFPLAKRALTDANPLVRMRAHIVAAWETTLSGVDLLTVDDEEVRYQATLRNPGRGPVMSAIVHFKTETSARVRVGIADQWRRYHLSYGGEVPPEQYGALMNDPDPRVRACVLEIAKLRQARGDSTAYLDAWIAKETSS